MLSISKVTTVVTLIATATLLLILTTLVATHTGFLPLNPSEYETKVVSFTSCDGSVKAQLNTRVADTYSKQYIGLSRTSELSEDEGMIFKYNRSTNKTIVMRNMDFPIDVIFVNSQDEVTAVHSLDEPQGFVEYYFTYDSVRDSGKYVIETEKAWAQENNISEGDCIRIHNQRN